MLLRADGEREAGGLEARATARKCEALAFPLKQSGHRNSAEERNMATVETQAA